MNFELGKSYIVDVTEKGVIPVEEFNHEQWFNKDCDDLEFLTDEEKAEVVHEATCDIQADFEELRRNIEEIKEVVNCDASAEIKLKMISNIIDAPLHYFKENPSEEK